MWPLGIILESIELESGVGAPLTVVGSVAGGGDGVDKGGREGLTTSPPGSPNESDTRILQSLVWLIMQG